MRIRSRMEQAQARWYEVRAKLAAARNRLD
jgi:hypothetical protein